ncbi:MAG: alpha/beta fold hydrolase [Acidobacteria bacterium]|nr:alpha/beta fold hydrolase [Acidobacteriota bacterium]
MKTLTYLLGWLPLVVTVVCLIACSSAAAQERRMDQDPSLNNLQHAADYETAALGELGRVLKVGDGPRSMVLIAGAGFGGEIWERFMAARVDTHTMYAVTLPGFGGTAAPPMPPEGTSYGDQTWTNAAIEAVVALIDAESMHQPVIVGHWLTATQVAIGVAAAAPNKVGGVIVISGVAGFVPAPGSPGEAMTFEQRVAGIDQRLAPFWFKTVTRDTWDDNNFYPSDYAQNRVRALQLWRVAAQPTLPTWIRYLCESWSQDARQAIPDLTVPLLLIIPRFDEELPVDPDNNYMQNFLHGSWDGAEMLNDQLRVEYVEGGRIFIMDDQPDALARVVDQFLAAIGG